jgi:hypothetical protein
MGSFLIRGGVAIVVLGTLWLFTAQSFSLLIDRVYTVPLVTLPSTPLGWNGTYLQFGSSVEGMEGSKGGRSSVEFQTGSQIVDLEGPGPDYHQVATLKVDAGDKLVLSAGGHRLTLGSRAGTLPGGDGPIPAFAAEPGDKASVTLERSWLSWPTPLEMNFMTGQAPSWRRHLYYRLSWKKISGARLDMLWRFEQRFDAVNGWGAPENHDRTTGLIYVDIRPVPPRRIEP